MHKINKGILSIFTLMGLAEILSLFGYLTPALMPVFFALIALGFLLLCLEDTRYGIFILLAELFIGSKGYLFYLDIGDNKLSIRIVFWLILMAVWAFKKIPGLYKNKKLDYNKNAFKENLDLFIFFGFIGLGLLNGIFRGNGFSNIFFDFNGWLYFLLALPILDVLKSEDLKILFNIFIASTILVCAKSLAFFYAFSHFQPDQIYFYYRWLRDTGVGEITYTPSGFYRIFFQSQIFVLAGMFIVLASILPKFKTEKFVSFLKPLALTGLYISVLLISFSRSFWVGAACGLALVFLFAFWRLGIKVFSKIFLGSIAAGAISLVIIFATAYFPLPKPLIGIGADDFASRLGGTDEAGASSRISQLKPLWDEIKKSPILGQGFGKTVTYKSSDPRILKISPDGQYTAFAFEWGWLDIWLKLGLLGLLAYIILIMRVGLQAVRSLGKSTPEYEKYKFFNLGIAIGLISICAVSVFSPYTNHPLGIGYLILALSIMQLTQGSNQANA